jgi:hypothetical protein
MYEPLFETPKQRQAIQSPAVTEASHAQKRVTIRSPGLPEGLKIFNTYKDNRFEAEVRPNEKIEFNGQIYDSPSAAAVAAIRSTGSQRLTEDGWKWWRFTDPETGEEKLIDVRRQ